MLCGPTRARRKVYLSHAISRSRFGAAESRRPSPFLAEIPDELLDKSGWSYPLRSRREALARRRSISLKRGVPIQRPAADSSASPFRPGDKVTHQMFGAGTVVTIPLAEGDDTVTVAFEEVGLKKLALALAPLEKV